MILRRFILPCLLLAWLPAAAQVDPVTAAKRAAQKLDQAAMALQQARQARDRVDALTRTIRAYEDGLAALRAGLRRAAIRERALRLELAARREEISRLLGVLSTMQRAPETLLLLHPAGPLDTARAGMLMGEVTPALQVRADALRAKLDEVALLRAIQQDSRQRLAEAMQGAQSARTALSQALSERRDLPPRFADDSERLRQLLEGTDTLNGFARGLARLEAQETLPPVTDLPIPEGSLPLPVQGTLLRAMNEADAAGVRRPGWVIATPPLALVTAPVAATVRYAGPLLDYGNVMILEPSAGTLLVLAGLAQVYAEVGEVLPTGAPVGLMGGADPKARAFPPDTIQTGGAERTETLYMELRRDTKPVDPGVWFKARKD